MSAGDLPPSLDDQPRDLVHDAVNSRARRDLLLREYTDAIVLAQTSHSSQDWIVAGSAFRRYAEAAVVAESQSRVGS